MRMLPSLHARVPRLSGVHVALALGTALITSACGDDSSDSGGGGDASTGAASSGGASGGSSTGGSSPGGAASGGSSPGGASTGGAAVGGSHSGGTSNAGGASSAGGAGGSSSAGGAGTGGSPGSGGAPADGGGVTCTSPVFVTSDHNGGWSDGEYYVHNNMWNSSVQLGPETLSACSYHDWYVVSNQTNEAGAVKTYPNVHKDYADVPISSLHTITSTFAASSPHVGIYDVAYDIWTNGVAAAGSTEFMIWTENYKQVPAGDHVATAKFGGRDYDVWKTSNDHYIAFVPTEPFTSGSIDLLEIFHWTTDQGWFPADSTLGQIDFGVEIVSTEGADATFRFTDFSITTD